mmetsp:Transcript_3414/g.6493  ORF Transcript_3414/g.6493 Transcript_3414/m.6493 type:complete len:262 (-) Transcript_3414:1159-1944(-)
MMQAPMLQMMQNTRIVSSAFGSVMFFFSVRIVCSRVHNWTTKFMSTKGKAMRGGLVMVPSSSTPSSTKSTQGFKYFWNSSRIVSASSLLRLFIHFHANGPQPKFLGSTKTIPARDTVAGEAYWRSPTSNNNAHVGCTRIRSPLGRVSNLLSSMTEFIFSTHSASTSPSKRTYLRSRSAPSLSDTLLMVRKMLENSPSVQVRVMGSNTPYSSLMCWALAFTTKIFVGSFKSVCAFWRVVMITVFPPWVGPTTIVVCRVSIVS